MPSLLPPWNTQTRREPEPSPGWFPTHLWKPLVRSFGKDHFVADKGDIVFYQKDPNVAKYDFLFDRNPPKTPSKKQ